MVKHIRLEVKNEESAQRSAPDSARRKSQLFEVQPVVSTSAREVESKSVLNREISYQVEVSSSRVQRDIVPTSKGDKFYTRAGTEIIAGEPEEVHNVDKEAEDIILEQEGLLI